jgi:hypothetical protein
MVPMEASQAAHATEFRLPRWAAAEFLDVPYAEGPVLRAIICRLSAGRWQWSVMTVGDDCGEVISTGTEPSITGARQAAASEIDKCIRNPLI